MTARTLGRLAAVLGTLLLQAPIRLAAHEIPNEVTVLTFVRPHGRRLTMLVRVPLKAMRDVDVPVRGGGALDLARIDRTLHDAATLWIGDFVEIYENGVRLRAPAVVAARVSLPSDRSFETYDRALALLRGPALPSDTEIYWEQGMLDVAFEYPIASDRSDFAVRPGLTRLGLRVNVVLRFLSPTGVERAFDVHGDAGIVRLDPRWHQAARRFVGEGFRHILDGIDHLLFLLCLVVPFRRLRPLVVVVTSFTVAHSVTLIASAFGMAPAGLWFPPLVEALIAVSIVYMAFENIIGANLGRRWVVTFGFGLVHGFGFSFVLSERLQFAGSHLLTSLVAFNVGVEIGQLAVLLVAIPVLDLLFRRVIAERLGTILVSALVAHTGWHWAVERGSRLGAYPWPSFDVAAVAGLLRLLILVVLAAALVWLLFGVLYKPQPEPVAEDRR
jgi:hypothetical protein